MEENRIWADKIIQKTDPSFKHRWDVYNNLVCSYLTKDMVWLDIGCGNNSCVRDLGNNSRFAVGLDVTLPENGDDAPYICGDLSYLPFQSESFELITLRFVVEHLKVIPNDFYEIERVLKSDGFVIILTTNAWSPFIFFPRILLPSRLKNTLLRIFYKVKSTDIFQTFHKFNSQSKMQRGTNKLKLNYIDFLQDANYTRQWLFLIFYGWHLLTKTKKLKIFRTNILAVFSKDNHQY